MIDSDRTDGRTAGRVWAQRNAMDLEIRGLAPALISYDALLAFFAACLDPEGRPIVDDGDYDSEGQPRSQDYIRGWMEGVQAAVTAMTQHLN
jgi:hypothetical protein